MTLLQAILNNSLYDMGRGERVDCIEVEWCDYVDILERFGGRVCDAGLLVDYILVKPRV